jgi:isopenicillin N synthase-like dioxygenase
LIPGFRENHENYLAQVSSLATEFIQLFSEALGLPPNELNKFYDTEEKMQHRSKLVQYPISSGGESQGVGPHYDAGFVTIVSALLDIHFISDV